MSISVRGSLRSVICSYADALILAIEANAKVPRMELNLEAASPLDNLR
jgi:hypothetical protein